MFQFSADPRAQAARSQLSPAPPGGWGLTSDQADDVKAIRMESRYRSQHCGQLVAMAGIK